MTSTLEPDAVDRLVAAVIGESDPVIVKAVVSVMREEVFLSTIEELDALFFRMGSERAHSIVLGRMARPFVVVEFIGGERRVLCPDGLFAPEPVRPARYASQAAALRAAGRARNRTAGAMLCAAMQPYLSA